MMLKTVSTARQGTDETLAMLGRWSLTVSASGELWIKPRQRAVTLEEFGILVKRMVVETQPGSLGLIIFDLTEAIMPRHKHSVCANLVRALGHRLGTPCVLFPVAASSV